MTIKEIVDEFRATDDWKRWLARYNEFTPKFIEEAKKGSLTCDEINLHEFFSKGKGHYVASVSLGNFSHKESKLIIDNWDKISGYLKQLAENQTKPDWGCYANIKNEIEMYTRGNRPATNRLIASLQPQLLCTMVSENSIKKIFSQLKNEDGLPKYVKDDWFRNSYNLLKFFKEKLPNDGYSEGVAKYPWEVFEYLSNINTK